MARSLPAALETEFDSAELKPFYAVEIQFDSGTVYFWTGYGTLTADGKEWVGTGEILGISAATETTDLQATGLVFSFNGLDESITAVPFVEPYQGRTIKLYVGALDADNQPVSTLYEQFSGFMDVMSITEGNGVVNLDITCENRLIDLQRPRKRLYTNEEQLIRYPSDNSLEVVASLQDKSLTWGKSS